MRSFFLAISLVMLSGIAPAQQKKRGTLEDVGKTLDSAGGAFRDIFKGKKDKSNNNEQSGKAPANTTENNTGNIKKGNGLAGSIHPNAVYIDADAMDMFNNGAAIIRKVALSAMIDRKGRLLVPYGQVTFSAFSANGKFIDNGLFMGLENSVLVCYFSNGKKVTAAGANLQGLTHDGNYVYFHKGGNEYIYVDKNDNRITVKEGLTKVSEGIGLARRSKKDKFGIDQGYYVYTTLQGKVLTSKDYAETYPFSDGMAVVGEKDQFGTIRYGFIDVTGKEIVPPIFTSKPSDFKNGWAKVLPVDRTQFHYAYVNKKGDIAIKRNSETDAGLGTFSEFMGNGFAFAAQGIMDSTGKIIKYKDLFPSLGFKSDPKLFYSHIYADQKGLYVDGFMRVYMKSHGAQLDDKFSNAGFYNIKTGKIIQPAFRFSNLDTHELVFSPFTKLAYARKYLGRDASGRDQYISGYINEDGVYEIVQQSKGTW